LVEVSDKVIDQNDFEGKNEVKIRQHYQFGHNFVKDDGTSMRDTEFDNTKMVEFFEFINFLHKNYNLTSHQDFKDKATEDIPEKTKLTFIPAQDSPYTEGKLHS